MSRTTRSLLLVGVALELLIVLGAWLASESLPELFKYAARYSGRLSAVVFLATGFTYARASREALAEKVQPWLITFAVLHLIHFGLLATNVLLNHSELEMHKLAGGCLAYLMIVAAPFGLLRLKRGWHLVYFYYVTFVMVMTYLARLQGQFDGAEPSWVHWGFVGVFGVGVVVFSGVVFGRGR